MNPRPSICIGITFQNLYLQMEILQQVFLLPEHNKQSKREHSLPNKGTPDAVGGAASTKISSKSSKLPNIVNPWMTYKENIIDEACM